MPQLPFVVAPKRETRTVSVTINGQECSLEFPVFGSLLTGEEIAIRATDYQAAVNRETSHLADALVAGGADEDTARRQAIRCVSIQMGIPVTLDAAERRILLHHADLLARIQSVLADEHAQQVRRTVTAVIANRLPGMRSWTTDDTDTQVPGPLQVAIHNFAESERNANQPARSVDELVEAMVDALGKLGPDSGQSPPTGMLPTGDAVNSGPMPESSTPTVSPGFPSRTSSRRSKKASAAS